MNEKAPIEKKKGNWKKVVKVILITFLVLVLGFAAFVVYMLGSYGIGPLHGVRDRKLKNLEGNSSEYIFDSLEAKEDSPLAGKTIFALGSSVTYGEASFQEAVGEYFAKRYDAKLEKEAVSGTTLIDNGENSYVSRMKNKFNTDEQCDLFVVQLSTNDARIKAKLGNISDSESLEDFDTNTITGAMEYITCYVQEHWKCPVVFYTGSYFESAEYEQMVKRVLELEDKYDDFVVLNLYDDQSFNAISDKERSLYMFDEIHPTKAGYRDWWGPELEKQLDAFLAQK